MVFLHILNGVQSGIATEIATEYTQIVGNTDKSIIYLDNNEEIEFSFIVNESTVKFSSASHDIIDMASNVLSKVDVFKLPIMFMLSTAKLAITNSEHFEETEISLNAVIASFSEESQHNRNFEEVIIDTLLEANNPASYEKFKQHLKYSTYARKLVDKKSIDIIFFYFKLFSDKSILFISVYSKKVWLYLYKKLGLYIYLILMILVILAGSIYFISAQIKQDNITLAKQQQVIALRQKIKEIFVNLDPKFSNLTLSDDAGKFQIKGVLANQYNESQINQIFSKYNTIVKFNLLEFNSIQNNISQILHKYNFVNSNVEFIESLGMISIRGVVSTHDDIDSALIEINNTYGGIGQIDTSHLFLNNDINNNVTELFISTDLANRINIDKNISKGNIDITGYASLSEIKDIGDKISQLNTKYNGVVNITYNLQDILTALPFSVAQVYTEQPGWIITSTGSRIYVGGSLDGVTLVSINANEIVFKGKFIITLKLDDLISGQYDNGVKT